MLVTSRRWHRFLVGPEGSVVGIDREEDVLEYAQSRVDGVTFVHGDFRDGASVEGPFDAVVGRYVLMYQSDPTDAVTALARKVRRGGVLAFHEMDIPAKYPPAGQWPESELAAELGAVILKVWKASGTQLRMGARLPSIYAEAGLDPDTNLLTEALVSVGREGAALTVGLLRSMEPMIRDLGLADLDQLDLDTAVERLVADAQPPGPINIGPVKVGAWARKKT